MVRDEAAVLPQSLEWVNLQQGASIEQYRGKVVLLLFWTYSNINSTRVIPVIREVLNQNENGVAVIGIHAPKYPHEAQTANVLKAINRHHVRFPVASDAGFEAWKAFDIDAWPSVVVLDVEGRHQQTLQGDQIGEALGERVAELLDQAAGRELRTYDRFEAVRQVEPASVLKFPTAVIEARGLLYISDTANNRVLEVSKLGRVHRIFGSGTPGFWDGVLANCGFNGPRGLAYGDNYLYVADTANHSIRRINLFNGEVETVLGNGKPTLQMTTGTRKLRDIGLDMPIGIAFHGAALYVCAAGMGQIWRIDLGQGVASWYSGTGQAGVVDGQADQAAFGLPCGLAVADPFIYVADADGNALRELRLQTGHVQTRLGKDPFVFGREDGNPGSALLQYPMDVAIRSRSRELWLADSFNNVLRLFSIDSGQLSTPEIDYPLAEPAGISIAGNTLWVANTNAHEVVRVDTVSRKCLRLEIQEGN